MKIRNFFAAAITLLSLSMFVACNSDEEYDQTFANNEKILKSEFAKSTIAPTKTIPAAIRAKMDSVELDIFSKLSTIGYVDYSFFDTEYYAENKQKILESLYQAYNKFVAEGKRNIYFSIRPLDNRQDYLRSMRITPADMGSDAVFVDFVASGLFSYYFEVRLNVWSNNYSLKSFSLFKLIPSDYTIFSESDKSVTMDNSGLACTMRVQAVFLNLTDSSTYNMNESKSVSLNFPPEP